MEWYGSIVQPAIKIERTIHGAWLERIRGPEDRDRPPARHRRPGIAAGRAPVGAGYSRPLRRLSPASAGSAARALAHAAGRRAAAKRHLGEQDLGGQDDAGAFRARGDR